MVKKILFIVSALLLGSPIFAFAAGTVTINPNIPGTTQVTAGQGPGAFVANFYSFALLIAGVLALGAIVFGGVKYAASAGNPSAQSDGKEWVLSAIYGIILLAGAYLILYTINPNLTQLNLPILQPVNISTPTNATGTGTGTNPTSTCPLTALAPITDPQAQSMEGGATVLWNSSNSQVQSNLSQLQSEVNKMQSVISSQFPGISLSVNSVYRPLAYQAHLYDIYQHATQFQQNPSYVSLAGCQQIISDLSAEEQKHGVCNPSGGPCLVASPSGCSDHPTGKGVDISVSPSDFYTTSNINAVLQRNNIHLQWAALSNDPVHFRLTNPPFTGCVSS